MQPIPPSPTAIIGGSFAGLAAAVHLARGRRAVTVFDDGLTRNRFASNAHGFPGRDGQSPAAIRDAGQAEVLAYPTAAIIAERVMTIRPEGTGFVLQTNQNRTFQAGTVILAHGMTDILPDLPGLAPLWGQTALQCPYCHGFEAADRPTAVLMTHPSAPMHARLLTEWTSDLLFLSNGHALGEKDRAALEGIPIVEGQVAGFQGQGAALSAILFQDGRKVAREILYLAPRNRLSCNLAEQLGCALTPGPFGDFITVDQFQRTSVPGVFAAGDITRPFYNATFAAADGVRAGVSCHQSLVFGPAFFEPHG